MAQAGVPGQPSAALVDELAGQLEVGGGAGLAVELGQRGLDDRVPVEAAVPAGELAHQVVGQAHGHGEQPAVSGAAVEGDGGLNQVPGAVHLVAPGQPGVPRLAAHLEVGVQVAVGALGLLEQGGDLVGERAELGAGAVRQFPADGLERLVDVRVHEHRPAVSGPGQRVHGPDPDRAVPARRAVAVGPGDAVAFGVGRLVLGCAVRLDRQAHIVQVARILELAQGERQAGVQVAPLPLVQQPGGQAGPGERRCDPDAAAVGATGPVTLPGGPAGAAGSRGGAAVWDAVSPVGAASGVGCGRSAGGDGRRHVGTVHVRGSTIQGIGFPRFPRKRRLEAGPRGVNRAGLTLRSADEAGDHP